MDLALNSDQMFDKGRREQKLQFVEDNGGHLSRLTLLGQMTSSLVLDTRQPLSVIGTDCGTAQRLVLSGDIAGGKIEALLARIIESVHWADDIVSFVDRMIARRVSTCRYVDVNAIGKTALQFLRSESFSRSVAVNFEQSKTPARVLGDEVQLLQVIATLLIRCIQELADHEGDARPVLLRVSGTSENVVIEIGPLTLTAMASNAPSAYDDAQVDAEIATCQGVVVAHDGSLEHNLDRPVSTFRVTLPSFLDHAGACSPTPLIKPCEAASVNPPNTSSCL